MKIKTMILSSVIALGVFACNNSTKKETDSGNEIASNEEEAKATSYALDTTSLVAWKGSMIGVYAHEGTLAVSGSITVKGGSVTGGSFTVDMASMVTTDDDALYEMAPREKLIGHLQSDDFFGSATFPTAEFRVTSAEGNTLTGDLTIKGVTIEESVTDVVLTEGNGSVTATGKLIFDRQKYGIAYENTMNDMVISDDIELTISISGRKSK